MKQLLRVGGHSATAIDHDLRQLLTLDHFHPACPALGLPTGVAQPVLHYFRLALGRISEGPREGVVAAVIQILAEPYDVERGRVRNQVASGDGEALWRFLKLPGRLKAYDPAGLLDPWVQQEIVPGLLREDPEVIKRVVNMPRTWQPDKWPEQRKTMVWQGHQWYEQGNSFHESRKDLGKYENENTLKSHYYAASRLYTPQLLSRSWLWLNAGSGRISGLFPRGAPMWGASGGLSGSAPLIAGYHLPQV